MSDKTSSCRNNKATKLASVKLSFNSLAILWPLSVYTLNFFGNIRLSAMIAPRCKTNDSYRLTILWIAAKWVGAHLIYSRRKHVSKKKDFTYQINRKKFTGKMCSNFNGMRFLALRNNLYKLNFIGFAEPRKVAETGSSQFMSLVLIKMT